MLYQFLWCREKWGMTGYPSKSPFGMVDFLYAGAPRILTMILQLALLQKTKVSRPVENNVIQQVDAYD